MGEIVTLTTSADGNPLDMSINDYQITLQIGVQTTISTAFFDLLQTIPGISFVDGGPTSDPAQPYEGPLTENP